VRTRRGSRRHRPRAAASWARSRRASRLRSTRRSRGCPRYFWLPGGAVELVAYAHSIDFGAKGYGNLVELAALQQHVAGQLVRPAGRLLMIVKSAHVYETERGYLRGVLEEHR